LLRHPFGVTPDLPQGRWYPYLGIGGGAEIAQKKGTPVFSLTGMAFAPGPVSIRVGDSATDTAAVLQLLAGLKIFFTRHVALFGEYKFTHADHTFRYSYQVCNGCVGFGGTLYGGPPRTEKFSTDVNHVVGGLAVHF
ncbi:MAG TPA: hypothetical protein VMG58_09840, partial [Candidatus Sulfotelmatobacter sp.]|nr:hypothetical protein [Candidatus Sulfotelmatobacter sp.]